MVKQVFLFPLVDSVLFKKVTLPFHIFEPRYRQMVQDSIKRNIPLAIVPYNPTHHYEGVICVAGQPHILKNYPDGQLDIYITGTKKFFLTGPLQQEQYNIYSCMDLHEDMTIDDSFETELESFKALLERWALNFLPDSFQRESFSSTLDDRELLINYCAVFLVNNFKIKIQVMQAGSMREKMSLLIREIGPKEVSLGPFMPTLRF
jgi:Lon protease-like protein